MDDKKTFRDTFLRMVALLGLILVLLLGAWGIILLAFNMSSVIATVGTSITSLVGGVGDTSDDNSVAGEALVIHTPAVPVASGQLFPVSWEHTGMSGQYNYALSYACDAGVLSIKAPTPAGKEQSVPCNTPFNYTGAPSAMNIVAQNSSKTPVDATITVLATRLSDNAITASASANVTVSPTIAAAPSTPAVTTGTTGGTYVAAPRVASLYGYPDLAVRIISVNSARSLYGLNTAQFEIVNAGSNIVSAGWNFEADLPIDGGYQYNSPSQKALYPGDKIVYTLSFSGGQNRYCTQQYPNYNCQGQYDYGYDNNYNNDARYDECGESHNNWDERDWMDWYQDAWDSSSNSRDDWDTNDWEDWYDDFCGDYSYNNSHNYDNNYNYNTGSRAVTIIVDPANFVREISEANNRATAQVY